ncbi:hypothetical protein WI26_04150 [Burkholderia diffusa]|nr:hypothetical protein WI26_04150 [Burkholderia diffusa]
MAASTRAARLAHDAEFIRTSMRYGAIRAIPIELRDLTARGVAMASSLLAEAKLLERYGGLRPDCDVLVFDPVHCYGLPGYLQIVDHFVSNGWRRDAFWPHGGHPFSLHDVSTLGPRGAEVSPFAFRPFNGLADGESVDDGYAAVPQAQGIGFELHADACRAFRAVAGL